MIKGNEKKKIIYFSLFLLVLIFLISTYYLFFQKGLDCSDGTKNKECSEIKPYYCLKRNFIKNVSICGCLSGSQLKNGDCFSEYQTEAKTIYLNYTLRRENKNISFVVYKGIYDHILKIPRYISSDENPTLLDFKLKNLDEEFQEEFIFPLVLQIQNITSNKEDQVRIAVSLVQNIPFGASDRSFSFYKVNSVDYQRYAYEVLYDMQGICSEKSGLLIFLLKKLGYGTAFIYYSSENHEATGIKCPISRSLNNTGYCFVETTGPSIIGDDKTEFVGITGLTSTPQIIPISNGTSLRSNMYEYQDSQNLIKIRDNMMKYGAINFVQSSQFKSIKEKYGLIDFSYKF